ncbi:hypothetical protein D3C78_1253750 [compost metagenome]
MATLQPGPQAGHQLRVHMEQRQAAEVAFAGGVATEHGAERPGVEDLGALGAHGDLRQAGGAAGAEVGGMVRGADGSSAGEAVVRLSGGQLGIAPVPGLLVVFGVEEEAQRGSLGALPGAALQGGVGALRQVVAGERSTFEVHDIGKGTEA